MPIVVNAFGPNALLARFEKAGDEAAFTNTRKLMAHLEHHTPPGMIEATPGVRTLLLEFQTGTRPDPKTFTATLAAALREAASTDLEPRTVEIPTVYDGPDLPRVAAHAGMEPAEVIRRHTAGTYRVQVLGFAPGFAYLTGLDRRLHIPRLATPRPQVPAGAVAIGGEHTGVYPIATAGGWNLIGRTSLALLDPSAALRGDAAAFLLRPGDFVRFTQAPPEPPDTPPTAWLGLNPAPDAEAPGRKKPLRNPAK